MLVSGQPGLLGIRTASPRHSQQLRCIPSLGGSALVMSPSWRHRAPLSDVGRYAEHKSTDSPKVLLPGCQEL